MMATLPLIILLVLFVIGFPIGFALMLCVVPYFALAAGIPMDVIIQRFIASTESTSLLAIPFFITAGSIMNCSGITERLLDVCDLLVGHVRGGLGHVNILLSTIMGGLSGSCAADAAQDCKILVPEMIRRGYDKPFCAAVTASSSLITCIIPPSIGLVVYAYCTDTSVGKMLAGGYVPGILMMIGQMILVAYLAKKRNYPPSREKHASLREIVRGMGAALWALGLPVILIVGLRCGIFSASEGGAVVALYALIVGMVVYRELPVKKLPEIMRDAVRSTCSVMLVMCAASVFSYYITWESIPQKLSTWLSGFATNPTIFLLLVTAIFLVIGMFMDGTTAMIIMAPILGPVAQKLGIDMVHFGVVLVVNCAIGAITPPFGVVIYLVAPMLKMRVDDFIKELIPFIAVLIGILLIMVFNPGLCTFIPNLIYG